MQRWWYELQGSHFLLNHPKISTTYALILDIPGHILISVQDHNGSWKYDNFTHWSVNLRLGYLESIKSWNILIFKDIKH